jgi:hypothetical protein
MFDKITSPPKKIIAHVRIHRTAYASTASFIAGAVVMRKLDCNTYGAAVNFITEKGLSDEFFIGE